jgi:hypothetical protein
MPNRAKWVNPDGLDVYFGPRYTENQVAGVAGSGANSKRTIEAYIRGEEIIASVADGASGTLEARSAAIPAGSTILSATLLVDELFVGATATLDVGTTNILTGLVSDMNGLVAAQAVAGLTAGARIVGAGAQVGTKISVPLTLKFGYNAAAFTAGSARVIVEYIEPPVQVS